MPITLDTVTLEYKSLPLLLREDGTAHGQCICRGCRGSIGRAA